MIRGFLIDIDGVICTDDKPLPGAIETIEWLRKQGVQIGFLTNTTRKCRTTLRQELTDMGISVDLKDIFSAAYATACYIRRESGAACHLLMQEDGKKEFAGLESESAKIDYVVVGYLGETINFELLNTAFQRLMAGAELIAMHKNRYWRCGSELSLNAGPFVAALEYASGKPSTLIGKPARHFFEAALQGLGLTASEAVMIGDDIEGDIGGAQASGIPAILVQTGKFRAEDLKRDDIKPDLVLTSIAEIKLRGLAEISRLLSVESESANR